MLPMLVWATWKCSPLDDYLNVPHFVWHCFSVLWRDEGVALQGNSRVKRVSCAPHTNCPESFFKPHPSRLAIGSAMSRQTFFPIEDGAGTCYIDLPDGQTRTYLSRQSTWRSSLFHYWSCEQIFRTQESEVVHIAGLNRGSSQLSESSSQATDQWLSHVINSSLKYEVSGLWVGLWNVSVYQSEAVSSFYMICCMSEPFFNNGPVIFGQDSDETRTVFKVCLDLFINLIWSYLYL